MREEPQKDAYHVSIVGPKDGKPQKGQVVWLAFVHPSEARAHALGRIVAERLVQRTGHQFAYHVEPVTFLRTNETGLLEEVETLAAPWSDNVEPRRAEERIHVEATFTCVADMGPLRLDDMPDRLVEDLRDQHGVELGDWLVVGREFPLDDEDADEREVRVILSLEVSEGRRLLEHRDAVDDHSIIETDISETSIYDDDARMDAITEDAEDAAMNAWGRQGAPVHRPNPHPAGTAEAEIWNAAFMRAYARENGK